MEASENRQSLKNIIRLLGLLFENNKVLAILLFLLTVVIGTTPAIEVLLIGRMIDQITLMVQSPDGFDINGIFSLFFGLIGCMLIRQWGRITSEYIMDELREKIGGNLQRRVLEVASTVDISFYDQEESYSQLQRANGGLKQQFINVYVDSIMLAETFVTIIAYAVTLTVEHWLLVPIVLSNALFSFWLKIRRAEQKYSFNFTVLTSLRKHTAYFSELLISKHFAKEIRIFHSGSYLLNRWKEKQKELIEQVKNDGNKDIKNSFVSDIFFIILLFFISIYYTYSVMEGSITVGNYIILLQLFMYLQQETENIVSLTQALFQEGLFATDLFRFLDKNKKIEQSSKKDFPEVFTGNIRFENVWFKYPNEKKWTIADLSFEMKSGETIALVGENGAGKSTIVKLLLGFYHPQKGTISFDGVSVERIDKKQLWEKVSAVFQDFMLFELSALESIGLGNVRSMDQPEVIRKAAQKSGANKFIEELDYGYNTYLSKAFGGTELSGGQWQKIALARNLLRNAAFMILDEPVSALDPLSELEVLRQFQKFSNKQTTLLISHRMGTARLADRIIVIKEGHKVEEGTHLDLLKNKQLYFKLFHIQAKWYASNDKGEPYESFR